jgi:hypothetical protein
MRRDKSNKTIKILREKSSNIEGKIMGFSPVKSSTINNNKFTNIFLRTIFRDYQHITNAYIL